MPPRVHDRERRDGAVGLRRTREDRRDNEWGAPPQHHVEHERGGERQEAIFALGLGVGQFKYGRQRRVRKRYDCRLEGEARGKGHTTQPGARGRGREGERDSAKDHRAHPSGQRDRIGTVAAHQATLVQGSPR